MLPPMTYGKLKNRMSFSYTILSESGPPFPGGGEPENDVRKEKPEKSAVQVYKIYPPVLRSENVVCVPENVHFRM